jgi:small conductance mechanosensitive channel
VSCGVGYESNLQEVEDMTVSVIAKHFEQKGNEEVEFFYTEFGESSINFIVRFWIDMVNSKQEHAARHIAVKLIKSTFNERKINIPFPIRTLDFGKNDLSVEVKNGPKNKGKSK